MTTLGTIFLPASRWIDKNRLTLYRAAIIAIVLASGVLIAPRAAMGQRMFLLPIVLYLGAGFALVQLRWPVLGLILTLAGGMLVRYSGPSGINVAVVGIAFMLGIWFFDLFVIQRKIDFIKSKTMLPVGILTIVSLLSFVIGQLPWLVFAEHAPLGAQAGGLVLYLLSFGAFILVANQIRSLSWLERLTWSFIALGIVYVLGRISGLPVDNYFPNGLIAGSMFWTWLIALIFAQALLNNRLPLFFRAFLLLVVAIALYELFFQLYDWKSGWLPALITIAGIFVFRFPRLAKIAAPFVLLPALYYLATRAISSDAYSWGTRLDIWLIVIDIAKISPIFGLGFSNYHFYTILVPIRGFYLYFNSHSQYVDLFAQVGLLGLVSYLWFFWETTRLGWWLRERVPPGFAQAYVYGALGGIAGTLVAGFLVDWTLPFFYNIGMAGFRASMIAWIFLGGLVSLEQFVIGQAKASELPKVIAKEVI